MIEPTTKQPITWCSGCVNFLIKQAVQQAILELIKEGIKKENFVSVVGIGCADKIYDYLDISGINGLHGRTLPLALGVKMSNPNLKVLGFSGDGGAYNEGINHLIHECRHNSDMTFIVNNNRIFALTTGQATSVTEEKFKEKTNLEGVLEVPINPIALVLESGASFVARLNAFEIKENVKVLKQAIKHKGFSFIEFLQPCIQFNNFSDFIKQNCYKINPMEFKESLKKANEWNYNNKGKIPIGIFYKKERAIFEEKREVLKKLLDEKKGFYNKNSKRKVLKKLGVN
jgi:2-oxoglutarate/2-oxoacid ferredoxin oxidoreductase subunit beta